MLSVILFSAGVISTALTIKCIFISALSASLGSAQVSGVLFPPLALLLRESDRSAVFPVFRVVTEKPKEVFYTHQRKYIEGLNQESTEPGCMGIKELAEAMCRYDLDDMDLHWLQALNRELDSMGKPGAIKG